MSSSRPHSTPVWQSNSRARATIVFLLVGAIFLVVPHVTGQISHLQAAGRSLEQGDAARAESEARLALDNSETRPLALAMLGTIRLQQSKYTESVDFLNQALTLNPKLVGARTTLGDAYIFVGKPALARKCFQEVLRTDPRNFNARYDLFKLEAAQRNFKQSLETAHPILSQLVTSDEGITILASDYSALGGLEELVALVPRWRNLEAPAVEFALDFGSLLLANGMKAEAAEVFDGAERQMPPHPVSSIALKLGRAFLALGRLYQAEVNTQRALSIAPDCVPCYMTLAAVAEKENRTEKALSFLVEARKLAPNDPEVLFQFGRICLMRDLLDDAFAALTKAVDLQPDNDTYLYTLGSANIGKRNLSKAMEIFEQLQRKHPNDPSLIYAIGAVYFLQADYSNAEAFLKQSLALQPNQISPAYYLGLTYSTNGQIDRAISVFREIVQTHPDHAPSLIKLGSLLARVQQLEEARQNLERGVALDPDSVEAHYQLGLLLRRMGRREEGDAQLAESKRLGEAQRAQKDLRLRLLLPD